MNQKKYAEAIEKLKKNSVAAAENINSVTTCPMCGCPCDIGGDDKEGTHYYIPRPERIMQ